MKNHAALSLVNSTSSLVISTVLCLGCGGADDGNSVATTETAASDSAGDTANGFATAQEPPPDVDMGLPQPSSAQPVVPGMAVIPSEVRRNEELTVVVKAKTAPTWHIYAIDKPTGVSIPTSLELKLAAGIETDGKWQIPEPKEYEGGASIPGIGPTFVYGGDVVFYRRLKVSSDCPDGTHEITCRFGYQACDDSTCLPPKKVDLTAPIVVVP